MRKTLEESLASLKATMETEARTAAEIALQNERIRLAKLAEKAARKSKSAWRKDRQTGGRVPRQGDMWWEH